MLSWNAAWAFPERPINLLPYNENINSNFKKGCYCFPLSLSCSLSPLKCDNGQSQCKRKQLSPHSDHGTFSFLSSCYVFLTKLLSFQHTRQWSYLVGVCREVARKYPCLGVGGCVWGGGGYKKHQVSKHLPSFIARFLSKN